MGANFYWGESVRCEPCEERRIIRPPLKNLSDLCIRNFVGLLLGVEKLGERWWRWGEVGWGGGLKTGDEMRELDFGLKCKKDHN
jgi:hypothetical protein